MAGDEANLMDGQGAHSRWDAGRYDQACAFVWTYGSDLVDLLAPQPGERILDLGCGTGHLTHAIAGRGAEVVGLDSDPAMIEQARQNYPDLPFVLGDGTDFRFPDPFDAVFSNAAVHWMRPPSGVVASVARVLRPDGRFVAEFGGHGNVQHIISVLVEVLTDAGYSDAAERNPWYFPSIAAYGTLLETHRLPLTFAALFDRPTALEGGETGLGNWLAIFARAFLDVVPDGAQAAIIRDVEARLRPQLFRDGTWFADYRRLRVVAVKADPSTG